MEILVLAFLGVCLFIGLAPKELTQFALAMGWAGMAGMALWAVVTTVVSLITR
jgi:Na+-translocating ferredoxin:NAD+ oxidoreductase RnfA subunit